ncbi:MAG: DUF2490 domain-containing protein [Aureispira sp.]
MIFLIPWRYALLLSLLLLLNCYSVEAQKTQVRQDFGAWIGFKIKKDFPKDFQWSLEQQIRTWKNSTRIDKYFAELGLKYTINKNFYLGTNLRYIHNTNRWEEPENALRYNMDLGFKINLGKKNRLTYRVRYQQRITHTKRALAPDITTVTRNRIKWQLKYKKTHKFYTGVELFIRREALRTAYMDRLRFSFGDKIKTKIGQFDVGVGYETNLQPQDPFSFFFVKIIHTLSL